MKQAEMTAALLAGAADPKRTLAELEQQILAESAGDERERGQLLARLGDACGQAGVRAPAYLSLRPRLHRRALELVPKAADAQLWAAIQVSLGIALNECPTGDRAENLRLAIAGYDAALTVRTREAFPQDWAMTQHNRANALGELAKLRPEQRETLLRQARDAARQAAQVHRKSGDPYQSQYAHRHAAIHGDALQDWPGSLDDSAAAIAAFDRLRDELQDEAYKTAFQEERASVFRLGIRAALKVAEAEPARCDVLQAQAFEWADHAKCRQMRETVHGGRAAPTRLADLAEQLPADTAVLEYEALGDHGTALFAVAGGRRGLLSCRSFENGHVDELLAALYNEQFPLARSGMTTPQFQATFNAPLADLRTALLPDALLDSLRSVGIKQLVLVPDNYLHYVPFHALALDDSGSRFLCDEFAVTHVQQAGLYPHLRERARGRPPGHAHAFVGPGGSNERGLPEHWLSLDASCPEPTPTCSQRIPEFGLGVRNSLVSQFGARLSRHATVEEFLRLAPSLTRPHIYSHGSFGPNRPEGSYRGQLHGGDERLAAKLHLWGSSLSHFDIAELPEWRGVSFEACHTLTLACCLVGRQADTANAQARELPGLPAVLLQKGVPALVGSLWEASQLAAVAFFGAFHEQLSNGSTRWAAYKAAQGALRADGRWDHPYFWAPFTLYGCLD